MRIGKAIMAAHVGVKMEAMVGRGVGLEKPVV